MKHVWRYDGEYWVIIYSIWKDYGATLKPPCPICKKDVIHENWNNFVNNTAFQIHECGAKLKYDGTK
jgi:hypothetical protein